MQTVPMRELCVGTLVNLGTMCIPGSEEIRSELRHL